MYRTEDAHVCMSMNVCVCLCVYFRGSVGATHPSFISWGYVTAWKTVSTLNHVLDSDMVGDGGMIVWVIQCFDQTHTRPNSTLPWSDLCPHKNDHREKKIVTWRSQAEYELRVGAQSWSVIQEMWSVRAEGRGAAASEKSCTHTQQQPREAHRAFSLNGQSSQEWKRGWCWEKKTGKRKGKETARDS